MFVRSNNMTLRWRSSRRKLKKFSKRKQRNVKKLAKPPEIMSLTEWLSLEEVATLKVSPRKQQVSLENLNRLWRTSMISLNSRISWKRLRAVERSRESRRRLTGLMELNLLLRLSLAKMETLERLLSILRRTLLRLPSLLSNTYSRREKRRFLVRRRGTRASPL